MTSEREEAIKQLKWYFEEDDGTGSDSSTKKAYEVALEALKEEPRHNPITNADKIRQMSDEELAEFFAKQEYRKPTFDGWLPLCNHVMGDRICHKNGCRECWIDWLKQEGEQ